MICDYGVRLRWFLIESGGLSYFLKSECKSLNFNPGLFKGVLWEKVWFLLRLLLMIMVIFVKVTLFRLKLSSF